MSNPNDIRYEVYNDQEGKLWLLAYTDDEEGSIDVTFEACEFKLSPDDVLDLCCAARNDACFSFDGGENGPPVTIDEMREGKEWEYDHE